MCVCVRECENALLNSPQTIRALNAPRFNSGLPRPCFEGEEGSFIWPISVWLPYVAFS